MSKAKRRRQQARRAAFVATIGRRLRRVPTPRVFRPRYVDPIAVERRMAGEPVYVTPLERRAAVQQLTRRGFSARQIADRVRVSTRTVVRCRRREIVNVSAIG